MFEKVKKRIRGWTYLKKATIILSSILIIFIGIYFKFFYNPSDFHSDCKSLILNIIPSIFILQMTLLVTYSYLEKHMEKEKKLEKFKNHINLVRSLFEELITDNNNKLAFRSLKDISISYDFRKLTNLVDADIKNKVEEANNILVPLYLNIKNATNFNEYKEHSGLTDENIIKICEKFRDIYNDILTIY